MNLFPKNRNNDILKQEAFILDETRKDNKVVKEVWKKNRVVQILALIFVLISMLSIIF